MGLHKLSSIPGKRRRSGTASSAMTRLLQCDVKLAIAQVVQVLQ
jgi:hypothetical protein